jgi:hypothetical protein
VVIIPGPKEPANIDPYIEDTIDAFVNHGPRGEGLTVTEHLTDDTGDVVTRTFQHTLLLGAVYGDSPGIKKICTAVCQLCRRRTSHFITIHNSQQHSGAQPRSSCTVTEAHSQLHCKINRLQQITR